MSLSENNSENKIPPENSGSFEYNFSGREIKLLARFLRKNQPQIPAGLENFSRKVELYIYSLMSIDEVEKFFSTED